MKELGLYQIRDMALASKRAVYSIQQLANLTGKTRAVAAVYASRLVKKKLAWRVARGKISFEQDAFILASQLIEPSYISLGSALLFHGVITQVQKNVACVNTKNSLRLEDVGIIYHKIPKRFFYGFKKHAKGHSYVMVAEPEKALLDGLYLNVFSQKYFRELRDTVSREKLKEFCSGFSGHGSRKLRRVVGIA